MSVATPIPGLYYSFVRPPAEPSPLRTDVAGFLARTERGPVGRAVRIEGWREYQAVYGGLIKDALSPYGIRGYFDNGGQVAYVIRLLGSDAATARMVWEVDGGSFVSTGALDKDWPGLAGLTAIEFSVDATSPGDWANQTSVTIRYWSSGASGKPEMEVEIVPPDGDPELLGGIDPARIVEQVNTRSALVRFTAADLPPKLKVSDLTSFAAPVVTFTGPGAFKATHGGYQYAYCYQARDSSLSPRSELSARTGDFSNQGAARFDVPASHDKQTIAIKVYRTTDGGAVLFELPGSPYPNVTQRITDAASDAQLNAASRAPDPPLARPGPRYLEWSVGRLTGGKTDPPSKQDYLEAVKTLGDQVEVALVACPDLYPDLALPDTPVNDDQIAILESLLIQAEELHDRLVIVDVPPQNAAATDAIAWVNTTLLASPNLQEEKRVRNGAVYHPRLRVPDPLGGVAAPLRCVPCSGLVAGVISRLDAQLGAYYTPANSEIDEAVDLSVSLTPNEQAALYSGGINLLRCSAGRGLLVWGGRVLGRKQGPASTRSASSPPGGAVAHRRLIHLLVRAIRRVAEPLVFDTNGPELWLTFVRSITSVLQQAYRAGALRGDTPDQAFRVRCDPTTNPPENIDLGLVICEIEVAPAFPMEFILLRVSASKEGKLEVFES